MATKLELKFSKAATHLSQLIVQSKLNDDMLLYLYARFKQVTVGKCSTARPSFFDFQAKKKWDAWNALGDMTKEDAQEQYINKISEVDPDWNEQYDSDSAETQTPSKSKCSVYFALNSIIILLLLLY